jgi:hypothetical protein
MKAYKGYRGTDPIVQPQCQLEVIHQLQALVTLSPEEVIHYIWHRSLVWLQRLEVLEKRTISCFCWEYFIHSKRQTESENGNI